MRHTTHSTTKDSHTAIIQLYSHTQRYSYTTTQRYSHAQALLTRDKNRLTT